VAAEGVEAVAAEAAVVAEADSMNELQDRVGLGWRADLAAGIFSHLVCRLLLEKKKDDFFGAPRREIRALTTL